MATNRNKAKAASQGRPVSKSLDVENEATPPVPGGVMVVEDDSRFDDPRYNQGIEELPDSPEDFIPADTDVDDDEEPIDLESIPHGERQVPRIDPDPGPSQEDLINAEVERRLQLELERVMAARIDADLEAQQQSVPSRTPARREQAVIVDPTTALIAKNEDRTYVLRTNEDVGPVYYGAREIELKAGRKYRVTEDIYQYLDSRGLIYSMH